MTTIYDYADVLRALADKEALQIYDLGVWEDISPAVALQYISDCIYAPELLRVKPKTIIINGVECPDHFGQPTDHTVTVTWRSERERKGSTFEFCYADQKGAEATFYAMTKPLRSLTE